MGKTILESFKGSPYDLNVKKDTGTLIEQELTGIRIHSAVDLNNPLIYGSDTIRIASRSTRTLETIKDGTNPTGGDDGAIGTAISKITGGKLNSISSARNAIADKIGIPRPLLPTVVANKLNEVPDGVPKSAQDIVDDGTGSELGKFLKQNARGNPKTILKQSLGGVIKLGKDKLRTTLFGTPLEGSNGSEPGVNHYDDVNTYTITRKADFYDDLSDTDDLQAYYSSGMGVDLAKVSPVYGVSRGSNPALWESKLGSSIQKSNSKSIGSYKDKTQKSLSPYSPDVTYTGETGTALDASVTGNSLELKRGLTSTSDFINDHDVVDPYSAETKKGLEGLDLIPFWIGYVNDDTFKLHFRTIISGLTETVSPSWSGDKFTGNPFSYHTYDGVERGVSLSLQLYCSNERELLTMWNRITKLTEYTYPSFNSSNSGKLVKPPIIDFRLGDIYVDKIGFIESLSYTFPDNGTWEIDPEIGLLPKFIEVSISIKFIENSGVVDTGLYGIQTHPQSNFSGEPIDSQPLPSVKPVVDTTTLATR